MIESDVEVPCPVCDYPVWVLLIEVVCQVAVRCPGCHTRVWLRDGDGSTTSAISQVQAAVDGLMVDMNKIFGG